MYESFYDLRSTPFTKGTPCKDLFMPKEFSEAVSRLEYVSRNQLFAVLTAWIPETHNYGIRHFPISDVAISGVTPRSR